MDFKGREATALFANLVGAQIGLGDLLIGDEMTVGVVRTDETWVGITNPDDIDIARAAIAELRA